MSKKIKARLSWESPLGVVYSDDKTYFHGDIRVAILRLDDVPALVEQLADALRVQDSGYIDMYNYRMAVGAFLRSLGIPTKPAKKPR